MFLLLLTISSHIPGIISDIVYYLSFILPVLTVYYAVLKGEGEGYTVRLKPTPRAIALGLLLALPFAGLMMALSALQSLMLSSLGYSQEILLDGSLAAVIITHAVLPAMLEELLFRYAPIKLLAPHSPRAAVVLSAISFSLTHLDPYSIGYALAAGLVLAFLDVITESIWPSVILHLANNVISILWIKTDKIGNAPLIFIAILAFFAVACIVISILLRKRLFVNAERITKDKCKLMFTSEFILFCSFCIILLGLEMIV
jgi:membrane protease YdiL (CAAX protease family)